LLIFHILMSVNIEKIGKSTAEAFSVFYEQYLPKIFRYISFKVSDKFLAEDITSAVFEKALTKFKTYSSKKAAVSTWIFAIARNTLIDYFRSRSKEQTVQLDESMDIPEEGKSIEEKVIEKEEWQVLRKCISRLNPNEQEIISLKFGSEMTNRQIAGVLGISDSNVGVILYRAIRRLRDDFGRWQNE
jgi:RNA polymerase sigma factor (sigma-70 family)